MDQFSDLSEKLRRQENLSLDYVLSFLRHCRRNHIPSNVLVLASSGVVISRFSSLPDDDDILSAFEQIFEAAIFLFDAQTAELCLERLQKKFPDSSRVRRLEGLLLEASGDNAKALEIYDGLIESAPTNMAVWKRKIAILRSQPQKFKDTVIAFNEYLQLNQTDITAWLALSDIYLSQGYSEQSSFCIEECILITPSLSPAIGWLNCRLGLTYASQPSHLSNIRTSLRHFNRSLSTLNNKIATHFGIIHVCDVLISANSGKKTEMDELDECKQLLSSSLSELLLNDEKVGRQGIKMSDILQHAFRESGKGVGNSRQQQQSRHNNDNDDDQAGKSVIESKNSRMLEQPEID